LATQIDLLAALQEIDQRLQHKERALLELRQQVAVIAAQLEAKKEEAEERQRRISELETNHQAIERRLREEEDKIKEKRVRLNRVRNERELLAMRREVETMKEANGKLEEEALRLLEQLDQEKKLLADSQTHIAELQNRITQETTQVEAQVTALEEETQRERGERERMVPLVDADLRARYERIFARRGGVAVVEIRAGTCQGCHMHIPPHMGNQIRSNVEQNTGVIFHCPHCGRILYWRAMPEGASDN
jgi:predicted  nucleic acid-binding Zn-ribbon protein